ncbi:WD40 repeat domain-containing protein [Nocardia niigatensis]
MDSSTGRPYGNAIDVGDTRVNSMALSPDGQTLATATEDKTVQLWDWRHGKPTGTPLSGHEFGVETVAFSDDGRTLYSRSVDSVRIWDTATRRLLGTVKTRASTTAMAISPDGRRIAIADYNYIEEFNAKSAEPTGAMIISRGLQANALAYSGDGRYLVSVGGDNTLRLWDVDSKTQIGEAVNIAATGSGDEIQFSQDQRHIFITTYPAVDPDGGSRVHGGGVWTVPAPAAWADELCTKLVTNPSQEEWKKWVSSDQSMAAGLCPGKREPP